jgi:hypothetical protein
MEIVMSVSNTPQISGSSSSTAPPDATEFAAGFARVEAEVRAVPESSVLAINIDVPSAVATVLGALREIRGFRDQFAQLLGFDLVRFDKLRDYTLALAHTQTMFRVASSPSDGVSDLADQVAALRDTLQADAMALAKRKILDEGQVMKLRGGSGYKNMAFEVAGLVRLFRDHWDGIQGNSGLKFEELEPAGELAQELVTAVGLKEQAPAAADAVSLLRQQAFSLFMNAYDDARRGVSYLRWNEGDVDDIAPSLFAKRGGRGTPVDPPQPPAPPAPTPIAASTATVAVPAQAAPVGLPGSAPFGRA